MIREGVPWALCIFFLRRLIPNPHWGQFELNWLGTYDLFFIWLTDFLKNEPATPQLLLQTW